jgi:Mg2+ and Co2+ transporter CorA
VSQRPHSAHDLTLAQSPDNCAATRPGDATLAVGATVIEPGSAGPLTGVIWAFDFCNGKSSPVTSADLDSPAAPGIFRWVHLNLSDQSSRRWIDDLPAVDGEIADMLLAGDGHQHVRLVGDTLTFAVHDFEREFDERRPTRTGVLIFLLAPQLMVTARRHPLFCADVILRRIEAGAVPAGAPAALDLLFSALIEVSKSVANELASVVRVAEDALIDYGRIPDPRVFVDDRRRAVMLHRQLVGLRSILHRLELDNDLPEAIRPTVEKVIQQIVALDGDVLEIHRDLRQLREEVDMQTARHTNQNLYVLSILSALLLPPTLVSSFFGMNTGGLPWLGANNGSLWAFFLMVLATTAVIAWLYRRGFFRNGR